MNKSDKAKLLKFLSDEIDSSKVTIFAEFSKLSVKEMEQLRREMKKYSTKVMVVKNTLIRKAFQTFGLDEAMKFMEGPNVLVWSKTADESDVVRELLKYSKSSGKIKVKFGILNKSFVGVDTIEKIGTLPSKKTLQAMVIGGIRAPLNGIVYNIKYPITRLMFVLKTFSEKKEKEK
ncbi:MAG TPA: 50S ribosomal protein L10 [bacterium]|nr:50S ribosomal protein L10 [bacterium]HOL35706.1 50S ribosomal protein L10 [bacterium]HPP09190.1 50S ribosomal protein L10 [bacterium]